MNSYKDYILLFLVVVFSSGASTFAISEEALIVSFVISLAIFFQKSRRSLEQSYSQSVLIFGGVCLLYYFINDGIDLNSWLGLFVRLFFSFNVIQIVGDQFADKWIRLIRFISIVSIVMFIVQLIVPALLFDMNDLFSIPERENSNSILFNFMYLHQYRNCGPMWEPGVFAALLIITLFISEVYKKKLFTKYNFPIILALLTTFSTTGYLALLVITVLHFIQEKSFSVSYYILLFIVIAAVASFQIIDDKITSQYYGLSDEIYGVDQASDEYKVSISRYASFVVDYDVFAERPWLGYGADILTTNKNTYFQEYGENINRSSGIMSQLVRFGLVGLVVFFGAMYKSFKSITSIKNSIGGIILLLLLLFSSPISYSTVILMLLFLVFTKSYAFSQENKIIKNETC